MILFCKNGLITSFLFLVLLLISACNDNNNKSSVTDESNKKDSLSVSTHEILGNTKWVLIEIDGLEIDPDSSSSKVPHLIFDISEMHFSGNMGCNQIMGGFEANDGTFNFNQVASTKMLCPDMEIEDTFSSLYENVTSYTFESDRLVLQDIDMKAVFVFKAN